MIIRQLKQLQYEQVVRHLSRRAHTRPLEVSFDADLTVNECRYTLRVQPERHGRIAALQAWRVAQRADGPRFEIITGGALLSSLLELLIDQCSGCLTGDI